MQDIKTGLSDNEVIKYREKYGSNRLERGKKRSFFSLFISNFSDPIIRVLIIALFLNIIFVFPNINWFESGGIAVSICISTLVSALSEYSNENAFERLRAESESSVCLVRRMGEVREISAEEIVVNDIIILNPGMRIQADAELLSGELGIDESALTGESTEVKKNQNDKKLLKGALICSGYGEAIVRTVGKDTYYGKIAGELTIDTRPSPLKHRLSVLAKSISKIGYITACLVAIAYLFNAIVIDSSMNKTEMLLKIKDVRFMMSTLLSALTLAISVIVVAVPEGLPMMITVVLSSNMKKMMRDNVIVRKLTGIETSGNINLLFTDKTGTLTEGKLKVMELYSPSGEKVRSFNSLKEGIYKKYLTQCAIFCGNNEINGRKVTSANQTDKAICEFVRGSYYSTEIISKTPFDSAKKYSAVAVNDGGKALTFFKGAPEKILNMSQKYMDVYGVLHNFDTKEKIFTTLKEYTSSAYRVVAMGYKNDTNTELSDIIFLGFLAIRDKVRKEVPTAIKEVSEAGVGVIMITGDNKDTAEAIAKECGIITPYSKRKIVLTGEELSILSDNEIGDILDRIAVIARVLPSDKSRLVQIGQKKGYVVGMTGDGINDASSLKRADVGFAMGSGTDVAKDAGDIVISDNNFKSICKAILYGRTIFHSIRKFIVFQLTVNLGATGISFIGPFIGVDSPVTVTQMLWVNIIMDTLGALAFASEPPLGEYMRSMPKSRDESILSVPMLKKVLINGAFILFLCVWFLKSDTLCMILHRSDEGYLLSAFFAMLCFMCIFVCFVSRTERLNIFANISKNLSFILIMMLIAIVQICFIYFSGDIFRCIPLSIHDLISTILISSSVVIFDFLRKLASKLIRLKRGEYISENAHSIEVSNNWRKENAR